MDVKSKYENKKNDIVFYFISVHMVIGHIHKSTKDILSGSK